MKSTTSQYIDVRKSPIHGIGIYAKKLIPKGAKIIQYVGEQITKKESDRRADIPLGENKENPELGAVYIFTLNSRYDIDGHVKYNTARYINHSCRPNCESDILKGEIWIISLSDIPKGTELSYNYGYDLDSYKEHPCRCGHYNCVGYILGEDYWPAFKRELKKTNRINRK
ncbi:MAG: SET domain-containing protein [Lysobacterales bacterium]|jgi:SET domain-containing protein